MYQTVIVAPPVNYDGHLLKRHVSAATGENFFDRMVRLPAGNLSFTTEGMPLNIDADVQAAVLSYVHPADAGAARTTLDVAKGV